MESLIYQIALTRIPGIGDVLLRTLVGYCGGVEEVFKQKKSQLLRIPGIGERLASAIIASRNFGEAEKEAAFIEQHGIRPLFYLDERYPSRLRNLPDAPALLYALGNADLNAPRIVGIVGTRKASDYGKAATEAIVDVLKPTGAVIISGLALGIDVTAHRMALQNGLSTVGVLAHGLNRIYPPQHKNIARQMLEQGGLLTEFSSLSQPDRENFPKRNRIVAGLCDVLVVAETHVKGGAMITAEIANTYNKEIMAVPGRMNDHYSYGCNALIKLHKAAIITVPEDVLLYMGWNEQDVPVKSKSQCTLDLSSAEEELVQFIRARNRVSIDDIACSLDIESGALSLTLLDLEFKGILRQLPGKYYELV